MSATRGDGRDHDAPGPRKRPQAEPRPRPQTPPRRAAVKLVIPSKVAVALALMGQGRVVADEG